MRMKSILIFLAVFLVISCCPSKDYFDSSFSTSDNRFSEVNIKLDTITDRLGRCNKPDEEEIKESILLGKYLKCYVIHPSLGRKYSRALLGIYTSTSGVVPAFSVQIMESIKVDSVIYIRLDRTKSKLYVKEISSVVPSRNDLYKEGKPSINALSKMHDFLIELESNYHEGQLSRNGWHKRRQIIVKRIESLFKVFRPGDGWDIDTTGVEYFSYSYNGDNTIMVGDTLFENFELETINSVTYLSRVEEDHYPHPPKD